MSRIQPPVSIDAALPASQAMLEGVQKQLGTVPNLFRLVSKSPAALEGYLGLSGALAKGKLPLATRERIALTVAELNGCAYCLSAHTYLGTQLARLEPNETIANRLGRSSDPKAEAALQFVKKIVQQRGHVSDAEFQAVKDAGYDDGQIIEIVLHVALNTWTNYINEIGKTDIDFPLVEPNPR